MDIGHSAFNPEASWQVVPAVQGLVERDFKALHQASYGKDLSSKTIKRKIKEERL